VGNEVALRCGGAGLPFALGERFSLLAVDLLALEPGLLLELRSVEYAAGAWV